MRPVSDPTILEYAGWDEHHRVPPVERGTMTATDVLLGVIIAVLIGTVIARWSNHAKPH